MATIEFITEEDLKQFRADLLQDLKEALRKPKLLESNEEWLKSYEVREILKISPSTLQTLRVNGTYSLNRNGVVSFSEISTQTLKLRLSKRGRIMRHLLAYYRITREF